MPEIIGRLVFILVMLVVSIIIGAISIKTFNWSLDHSAPVVELRATVQAMQTQIAKEQR